MSQFARGSVTADRARLANWMLRRKANCGTNNVMNLWNDVSTVHDNRQASRPEVPTETGQTAYKRELALSAPRDKPERC